MNGIHSPAIGRVEMQLRGGAQRAATRTRARTHTRTPQDTIFKAQARARRGIGALIEACVDKSRKIELYRRHGRMTHRRLGYVEG